jgi:hypothetical protein
MVKLRIETYLEVEGAGLGGVLELGVLVTLLEQSVELDDTWHGQRCSRLQQRSNATGIGRPHLEKLIVGRGLGELLAVLDGLLELGGLGDHVCG